MNNILVIAAHPDDEILGLGATVRKLLQNGKTVNVIILGEGLTSRKKDRCETSFQDLELIKTQATKATEIIGYTNTEFFDLPDNRFDSLDLLQIIKLVSESINKYQPDTIFTHHYGDLNIDHRITFDAVQTAARPVNNCCVKNIILFETPSSTEWNFRYGDSSFRPNLFFDVTDTLNYKLDAMSCYLTEGGAFPHPRSLEALETIAKRWGTVVGKNYVEAFEILISIVEENNNLILG